MGIFDDPNVHEPSMASLLLSPKMLLQLLILWMLFVGVGTGVAIFATKNAILSDFDVEQILSDGERLAEAANVAYVAAPVAAPVVAPQGAPVYPSRLVIPSLGRDVPVSNPQTRDIDALDAELLSASVRYPDSATLGVQGGNVLLFGHSSRLPVVRNQMYKAFNDIGTLSKGSVVQVFSGRDIYTYHVSRVYQASATDAHIPLVVPGHRLTLLTCDSFGAKTDRWVVEAEFIGKNI